MKEKEYKSDRLLIHSRQNRHNMTSEEKRLWLDFLRYKPFVVKRQYVIDKYIADFYILCAKLVIELDGKQHYTDDSVKYDTIRDEFIERHNIKVIRFSNNLINNDFKNTCQKIYDEVMSRIPYAPKVQSSAKRNIN